MPGITTTPSCPPVTFSAVAVTPVAPRSTRSPDWLPLIRTSRRSTFLPPSEIPVWVRSIVEPDSVRPSVVFSTITPRPPPLIRSPLSVTLVLLTWVNTPIGWSTAEKSETTGLVSPDSCSPPYPSAWVTIPLICGACWLTTATPNLALPVVVMPVIGRVELGPLTCTPLSPLRSARTPDQRGALVALQDQALGRRVGRR